MSLTGKLGTGLPLSLGSDSSDGTFQYAQAQASILGQSVFAQAQASIKTTSNGFAQAQGFINTRFAWGQAQARVASTWSLSGNNDRDLDTAAVAFPTGWRLTLIDFAWTDQATPTASIQMIVSVVTNFNSPNQIISVATTNGQASRQVTGSPTDDVLNTTTTATSAFSVSGSKFTSLSATLTLRVHTTWNPAAGVGNLWTSTVHYLLDPPVRSSFGQAQAKLNSFDYPQFGQAQAIINQVLRTGQAQARILATSNVFAQAQAKARSFGNNVFAQAQANIVQFRAFAQAQAKINAFDVDSFGQAQADILHTYTVSAQAQTYIGHFKHSQAQADIKATSNKFAQSQGTIKATSRVYAQAQARIYYHLEDDIANVSTITETTVTFSQDISSFTADTTTPDPPINDNYHSGWITFLLATPALVTVAITGFDTELAIFDFVSGSFTTGTNTLSLVPLIAGTYYLEVSTATNDPILVPLVFTYTSVPLAAYAQAQAKMNAFNVNNFAQAQAVLNMGWGVAQAQALLKTGFKSGQAQAFISKSAGYGQALADILATDNKFGQAQARIKQEYQAYSQAQARIIYLGDAFGQAQALVIYVRYAFGQAQVQIFVPILSAQAQADILQVYNAFAQAKALIYRTENAHAQAKAEIVYKRWKFAQATALIQRGTPPGTGGPDSPTIFGPPEYVVVFNGTQLPGYAQSESMMLDNGIDDFLSFNWDGTQSQQAGLKNQIITLEFLIYANSWDYARAAYRYGVTILNSGEGFRPLYIDYTDRHYMALFRSVSYSESVEHNRKTLRYKVDFECLPWMVGETSITLDELNNVTEEPIPSPVNPPPTPTPLAVKTLGQAMASIIPFPRAHANARVFIKGPHEYAAGLSQAHIKGEHEYTIGLAQGYIVEPTHTYVTGLAKGSIKSRTTMTGLARARVLTVSGSFSDIAPHWDLVFADEFDRTVAEGHFMDGSTDAYHTADGRYIVFKNGWLDTSKNGTYSQSHIFIQDGMLQIRLLTEGGRPRVGTLTCLPSGGSAKGGIYGMRTFLRIRADNMVHYKGVPLRWADAATTNILLEQYGEIDWPESSFPLLPKGYMHRTNSTRLDDQYVVSSPAGTTWQDWHDYECEWIPNTSVEFFIDGVSVGKTTSRVPNTPMHFNLQFETALGGEPSPDPSTTGLVQIERVAIWHYIP